MPAKPVVVFCAFGLAALLTTGGLRPVCASKLPVPTILLYPASASDVPALVDLRTRLRLDGQMQVLTYDTDSATVKRIAAETSHPEWLVAPALTDDTRLALARALGVAFYAVVGPGRETDSTRIELVETAPTARVFDWVGVNRQYGAHALESQAVLDLPTVPAVVASAPVPAVVASAPVPAVVASAPVPAVVASAPVPAVVASAPVPAVVASAPVPAVVASAPVPAVVASAPVPAVVASAPVPAVVASAPVPAVVASAPVPAVVASAPVPAVVASAPVPAVVASAPVPAVVASAPVPAVVASAPVPAVVASAPVPAVVASAPTSPIPAPVSPVAPVMVAQTLPITQTLSVPIISSLLAPAVKPMMAPKIVIAPPLLVARLPQEIAPQVVLPIPASPLRAVAAEPVSPAPMNDAAALPQARPEDLNEVSPLLRRGDSALSGGDVVGAISFYRQAVNGAPLSAVPRLKLAQAYQQGGMTDKSLDEAKRALEIAPDSLAIQQFLTQLDQENGTSDGAIARYRAMLERNPQDAAAHSGLADALWNSGDLDGAESEYKAAKRLVTPGDYSADAHLAQLYAAQARYDDCLVELQASGKDGYALAIHIVKNRSDTLSSMVDASRAAFAGGKSTREQFYDNAKKVSAQAQALAAFVAKVAPPSEFKLSHLHRMLATNLLAQEAATLVTFIETGDAAQGESVSQLDKEVQTEMLTARAAEEKRGLWDTDKREANN